MLVTSFLNAQKLERIDFYRSDSIGKVLTIKKEKDYLRKLDSLENRHKVKINSYFYMNDGKVFYCRRKEFIDDVL